MPHENKSPAAYAAALLALSEAAQATDLVDEQLGDLLVFLRDTSVIGHFANDLTISRDGKSEALGTLLESALHPVLLHFLLVVVSQDLYPRFPEIAAAFRDALSRRRMRLSGEVVTACPLSADRLSAIEREVGRILGHEVNLRPRVDGGVLGGVLVRVGDFLIDGTIDRQLETARAGLLGADPQPSG